MAICRATPCRSALCAQRLIVAATEKPFQHQCEDLAANLSTADNPSCRAIDRVTKYK